MNTIHEFNIIEHDLSLLNYPWKIVKEICDSVMLTVCYELNLYSNKEKVYTALAFDEVDLDLLKKSILFNDYFQNNRISNESIKCSLDKSIPFKHFSSCVLRDTTFDSFIKEAIKDIENENRYFIEF